MKKFLMLALVATSFGLMGADDAAAATAAGCHCQAMNGVGAQPMAPLSPAMSAVQVPTGRRTLSVQPGVAPTYRAPAMRSYRSYGSMNPSYDAGRKIRGQY